LQGPLTELVSITSLPPSHCLYVFSSSCSIFALSPEFSSGANPSLPPLRPSADFPRFYYMNNQLSYLRNSLCSTSLNADSCCCYNRSLYTNLHTELSLMLTVSLCCGIKEYAGASMRWFEFMIFWHWEIKNAEADICVPILRLVF